MGNISVRFFRYGKKEQAVKKQTPKGTQWGFEKSEMTVEPTEIPVGQRVDSLLKKPPHSYSTPSLKATYCQLVQKERNLFIFIL